MPDALWDDSADLDVLQTVPPIVDPVEMAEWFDAHGRWATAEELQVACGRVGGDLAPRLLAELEALGMLEQSAAQKLVGDVWSMAEYPDQRLARDRWRGLFALAGFTVDGEPAERPAGPLTLYRGSVHDRRHDWSWTDDLAVARGYARGTGARRPDSGKVWVATVEPWRLLARNTRRDESEYVVDTDGLEVREGR